MNQKGMALLMTLLIVALLSVLALGLNSRSLLALTRAKHSVLALGASYTLRSGLSAAMAFLEKDASESAIDTLAETWAHEVRDFPVGEGTVSIRIDDEASRFNVNTLVTPRAKVDDRAVERFGRLLASVGDEPRLAASVAEWLRSQTERSAHPFRDVSELRLVPGMTREALERIEPHVTVHTGGKAGTTINVNTVGPAVLAALSPRLTDTLVTAIIEHRKEHPFRQIGDLKRVPGMNDEILFTFGDVIDVRSSTFSVRADAKVSDVVRSGTAIVSRDRGRVKVVAWKEE